MTASTVSSAREMAARVQHAADRNSRSVKAHADPGDLQVGEVSVPTEVRPSSRFTVQVPLEVTPDLGTRFLGEPDACQISTFQSGLKARVEVSIDGSQAGTKTKCVADESMSIQVFAPESPGVHDVSIKVYGASTNNLLGSTTKSFRVLEPDEEDESNANFPGGGGNTPGGAGGAWLPCFLDPNRACGGLTMNLLLLLGGGFLALLIPVLLGSVV